MSLAILLAHVHWCSWFNHLHTFFSVFCGPPTAFPGGHLRCCWDPKWYQSNASTFCVGVWSWVNVSEWCGWVHVMKTGGVLEWLLNGSRGLEVWLSGKLGGNERRTEDSSFLPFLCFIFFVVPSRLRTSLEQRWKVPHLRQHDWGHKDAGPVCGCPNTESHWSREQPKKSRWSGNCRQQTVVGTTARNPLITRTAHRFLNSNEVHRVADYARSRQHGDPVHGRHRRTTLWLALRRHHQFGNE